MVIAAALVLGSHAMHDAFAIIRWSNAGISPAVSSVLWSESVGAEVLVFVLAGPRLLDMLGRRGALALGAGTAVVRWGVMAQTTNIAALAAIEPLHGLTFALFHLACMRIIADTVPRSLAGMAQAFYGTVGIGGHNSIVDHSGRLAVRAFGTCCLLGNGFSVLRGASHRLELAVFTSKHENAWGSGIIRALHALVRYR